jgi:hypothetical protein
MVKICDENKIYNPITNRCITINKNSATFKKIIDEYKKNKINLEQVDLVKLKNLNIITQLDIDNHIIVNTNYTTKIINNKKCKEDKILNPITGRCVKINSQKGNELINKFKANEIKLQDDDIEKLINLNILVLGLHIGVEETKKSVAAVNKIIKEKDSDSKIIKEKYSDSKFIKEETKKAIENGSIKLSKINSILKKKLLEYIRKKKINKFKNQDYINEIHKTYCNSKDKKKFLEPYNSYIYNINIPYINYFVNNNWSKFVINNTNEIESNIIFKYNNLNLKWILDNVYFRDKITSTE